MYQSISAVSYWPNGGMSRTVDVYLTPEELADGARVGHRWASLVLWHTHPYRHPNAPLPTA